MNDEQQNKSWVAHKWIIGLWIASVVVSFCAGVVLTYEFYIFGARASDPVSEVTTYMNVDPPVDGPFYRVEDFVRANREVKSYLLEQRKKPEYHNLHPRFVVVPELDGYTIFSSSGLRDADFPKDLYESTREVMTRSLGEINASPSPPETQAKESDVVH